MKQIITHGKITLAIAAFSLQLALAGNCLAQNMMGISNSNYAGTNGIIANPSYAADSRHGFYLNIFTANGYATNTYYTWNGPTSIISFFKNGNEFEESYLKEAQIDKPSLLNAGVDVRGPSFLLKLGARSGLGIYTRMRGFMQANHVSPNVMQLIKTGITEDEVVNQPFQDNTFALNANVVSEIGFTYARTVWENNQHFLKAGFTVKKLFGAYSAHLVSEAMDFTIRGGEPSGYFMEVDAISARYGYNTMQGFEDNINPLEVENPGKGWGYDIGFTYEHRPNADQYRYTVDGVERLDNRKNKYDYKIGLSVLDIGGINYDSPFARSYAFERANTIISEDDLDDLEGDFADVANDIFDVRPEEGSPSFRSGLPTALKVDLDLKLTNKIYTSFTVLQNLKDRGAIGMRQNSMLAVTPRIETRGFELAFPVSLMNKYQTLGIGSSIKLGLLFIGSDNLAGALGIGKAYGADVYMGLAFPFSKGKKRDDDNDGVSNSKDECRNVAGTWEFKGCPDTDGDGIEDKFDKCPGVAGIAPFEGCPDSDGDGLQDMEDECPQVPGIPALKGCPDTDKDGVADHLDACKDVAGHVDLKGCPDADGDGIIDSEDKCPEHAGPAENSGCPDADGDVVPDHLDECPDEKGTEAMKGCPDKDEDGIKDALDKCPDVPGLQELEGCPDTDEDGVPDYLDECPEIYGAIENNGCP